MRRTVVGAVLILHALAHADAGMLAANNGSPVATVLWAGATLAFLAAGLGLLCVRQLDRYWQPVCIAGIACSIALLATNGPPAAMAGLVVDAALLVTIAVLHVPARDWVRPHRSAWRRVGQASVVAALAYVAVVILLRPWYARWGSTKAELSATLPSDELVPVARYTIQHAVTIHTTPDNVWPWLVQLGQDRGGFYSYDWLERLFGDRIHNADRIHPEWQTLQTGTLVRAVQPDYLGGVFGPDVGWRVVHLEPGRVLTLGGWGAFVLDAGGDSTRLIVRTRGEGKSNVLMAPFGLLVFEPAHFIMQRRMLLGIKERAERAAAPAVSSSGRT
jgi:hypothetical protein